MKLFNLYNNLFEQNYGNQKVKAIINAITNRHPITFYYSGPQAPPKDKVLNGVRVRAEVVAYGLSKKGNEIVRAYVEPPSTSLKGYDKTNWRTFRIDRMSSIRIINDEIFEKRDDGQYKEGDESTMGPMVKTYFTVKWDKKSEVPQKEKPTSPPIEKKPELPKEPEVEKPEIEPEPTSDIKPSLSPTIDYGEEIFKKLQPNIKDVNGVKTLTSQDFENFSKELYKLKEKEWIDRQKVLNKNIKPGEGTRKKFEIDSKNELSKILFKNNIKVSNEPQKLQETINRIKSLIFF